MAAASGWAAFWGDWTNKVFVLIEASSILVVAVCVLMIRLDVDGDTWPRWRTERLRRRATRRRSGGGRGVSGRRALRILARQSRRSPGGYYAGEALWQVWLAGPDQQVWELLRVNGMAGRVFPHAVKPDLPAAERARIGAFCAERGMAPANAVDRVLFFVLTGQRDQYRAADPDGALLTTAYQGAGEPVRAALRETLAGSGDLDLVGLVAGAARERLAVMTADEVGYLIGQLAGRRDWAGLWRLVKELPLVHAATAMASFADGWRPAGARDQALFQRLGLAGPAEIAEARRTLLRPLRIPAGGSVEACAFSPDGRRLAVATADGGAMYGRRATISVFELPGTTPVQSHEHEGFVPGLLLCLSDAVVASGTWRGYSHSRQVIRCDRSGVSEIWRGVVPEIGPHPSGFIALHTPAADDGEPRLDIYDDSGRFLRQTIRLADLGIADGRQTQLIAACAASGRVVLGRPGHLTLVDAGSGAARVLAGEELGGFEPRRGGCFITPEQPFLTGRREVRRYRLVSGRLRGEAGAALPSCSAPIPVPGRDEVALRSGDGELIYLDARTLTRVPASRELTGHRFPATEFPQLCATPDGRRHADAVDRDVNVVLDPRAALVAELAGRPQASLTLADLATVTAALRDGTGGEAGLTILEPVAASLERRFGAEVALGGQEPASAGADEIALAGDQP